MIGIIDYGVGNLQSVKNSLDSLNISSKIIKKPIQLNACDKIILPGVGAFGAAMDKLNNLGFAKKVREFEDKKKPILGICLGMQLLFEKSEEYGTHLGLGLLKGDVLPFSEKVKDLPLPQVGWNDIKRERTSQLLQDMEDRPSFYFVHSFYCQPADPGIVVASADYGIKFAAIVHQNNIFGCQFHPEKSQVAGLQLLKNFYDL